MTFPGFPGLYKPCIEINQIDLRPEYQQLFKWFLQSVSLQQWQWHRIFTDTDAAFVLCLINQRRSNRVWSHSSCRSCDCVAKSGAALGSDGAEWGQTGRYCQHLLLQQRSDEKQDIDLTTPPQSEVQVQDYF